jgi:hypothetical protein
MKEVVMRADEAYVTTDNWVFTRSTLHLPGLNAEERRGWRSPLGYPICQAEPCDLCDKKGSP